jgi:hypothetical protein
MNKNHDKLGRFTTSLNKSRAADARGALRAVRQTAAVKEYTAALTNSTHGGYANLQSQMRTGKLSYPQGVNQAGVKQTVKHLKDAFKKSSLEDTITVHRGMRVDPKSGILSAKPGQIIKDRGATSTSTSKDIVSKRFSNPLRGREVPVQMEITLPKGTKAIDIGKALRGRDNHEKEIVVAPRTSFRVTSTSVRGGKQFMKLTAITRSEARQIESGTKTIHKSRAAETKAALKAARKKD